MKARQLFEEAADKDYPEAMLILGRMYARGDFGEKDQKKTEEWFDKHIDKMGSRTYAMRNLGEMYAKGEDVEKDLKKAEEWFNKFAEAGGAQAMYELGRMHTYGHRGMEKDLKKAKEWYSKVIEIDNKFYEYYVIEAKKELEKLDKETENKR